MDKPVAQKVLCSLSVLVKERDVPCWFPVACGLICLEIFGSFTGLVKRGSMALFYGRVIAFLFRPSSQPPLIDLTHW